MKWSRSGSRVYGDGASYNCTNQITAEDLQHRLNGYEEKINTLETVTIQYKQLQDKLNQINKQVIETQMTLTILQEDLNKLKEALQC